MVEIRLPTTQRTVHSAPPIIDADGVPVIAYPGVTYLGRPAGAAALAARAPALARWIADVQRETGGLFAAPPLVGMRGAEVAVVALCARTGGNALDFELIVHVPGPACPTGSLVLRYGRREPGGVTRARGAAGPYRAATWQAVAAEMRALSGAAAPMSPA